MTTVTMPSITFPPAPNPTGGPPLQPFVAELTAPTAEALPTSEVTVRMGECSVHPHPGLPGVSAWGYGRQGRPITSPGPLLEARSGHPALVRWSNVLPSGTLPFDRVVVPMDDPVDPVQNHLGTDGQPLAEAPAGAPLGWLVTHLHGGHTEPESDGWPDHMIRGGQDQRCRYANDDDNADLGLAKVGPALWYHDHAMAATRLHVFAGLAGGYVIRHPREASLGLPTSAAEGEVVCFLQDRNLTGAADGSVRLLHKTTADTAEFFGPLTMVNGRLWPRLRAESEVLRLRLYNGSNARFYRLHLVDEHGASAHARVLVIGTDGGLLWKAVPLGSADSVLLAPAERIDLLVDLRGLAGTHLYLVNSASAPFSGDPQPVGTNPASPRPEDRLPFPQVMRIDPVHHEHGDSRPRGHGEHKPRGTSSRTVWGRVAAGVVLNAGHRRLVHGVPADPGGPPVLELPHAHTHRTVLLSESDPPGHLQLTEIEPDPAGGIELQLPTDATPQRYSPIASSFYDTVGFMPVVGEWEVWRFLNTTGDTHPIHIHQSFFQPMGTSGVGYAVDGYAQETHTTASPLVPSGAPGRVWDVHETHGWKDTIRLDPGELMSVAIRFDRVGRYVYHCHMIEHEDNEMMRPFVVTPVPMGTAHSHHM